MSKICLKSGLILSEILHRTVMPEQTIARVDRYADYLSLTELSCLDDLGIPVYAIVHNEIGNAFWGKGLTHELAKASALMEFVERKNAMSVDKSKIITCSFNEIKDKAISRFDLIPTNIQRELYTKEIYDNLEIQWFPCYSLFEDKDVYLPASLVGIQKKTDFSDRIDTNGLASGNNIEEALLHGLCELIERHAFDLFYFNKRELKLIDPYSCRIEIISELVERLSSLGFDFYLADHTEEFPVSVVSLIVQRRGESPVTTSTYTFAPGCHPHPEIAFLRCITEIAQVRVRFLYGKAVFKEYYSRTERPGVLFDNELLKRKNISKKKTFGDVLNISSRDIKTELDIILDYLKKNNLMVYIADMTSDNIPIPSIRVIVKNLQPVISPDFTVDNQFVRVSEHMNIYNDILKHSEINRKQRIENENKIIAGDSDVLKSRLCSLYKLIRDYDRGLEIAGMLYRQKPDNKEYAVMYGEFLLKKKKFVESADVFEGLMRVISDRRDIIICAHYLFEIYSQLGDENRSEEYIDIILGLYPPKKLPSDQEIREIYIKAQLAKLDNDIRSAEALYSKDRTPYTADKLFLLNFKKNDYKKALLYANDVVEMNPNLVFGWQHLIEAYKALNENEKANEKQNDAVNYFVSLGYSREKIDRLFDSNS